MRKINRHLHQHVVALILVIFFGIAFLGANRLSAYTYHRETSGPLTVEILKPEVLKQVGVPHNISVHLDNQSDSPLTLRFSAYALETLSFVPESIPKTIQLEPNSQQTVVLQVCAQPGTYTAHYPLYLDVVAEQKGMLFNISVVQPLETQMLQKGFRPSPTETVADSADSLETVVVPAKGGLFLPNISAYRPHWNLDSQPGVQHNLPIGWSGMVDSSHAFFAIAPVDRGGVKQAFSVHPPYQPGPGNIAVDYQVQFPTTTPLIFSFYGAVRDVVSPEPPTDGVTYRIWVNGQVFSEFHTKSTTWELFEVDLSRYAGETVLLTLETDPGPNRDPTCDSCFWGAPILSSGPVLKQLTPKEREELSNENRRAIQSGYSVGRTQVFPIGNGMTAAVSFGNCGFLDGIIGIGDANAQVQFDGLRVCIDDQPLAQGPSSIHPGSFTEVTSQVASESRADSGSSDLLQSTWTLPIQVGEEELTLTFVLQSADPLFQMSVKCSDPNRLSRIELGPATQQANRVYFGHGYCVVEPKPFRLNNGGHELSTSHVGFDFENGLSLLLASSFPPDELIVNPKTKTYTLAVHPDTQLTFLPGREGAMDCAIRYRPLTGKTAAPAVAIKAGRPVLDVWGNLYKDDVQTMRTLAKYGVKDLIYLVHVWQRYGYDNRLPDIWPPDPQFGTLQEVQEAAQTADSLSYLYGLHDNYIDFYPDAKDYSFDRISFERNGVPRKGWDNLGIEAQAYQFRPDQIFPFLQRNLDLISSQLALSTYFVDVFASTGICDFYDRTGRYHNRAETLNCWNQAFDIIRERLSERHPTLKKVPTISEGGSDFLIGHLDGADCQFLLLSEDPGEFRLPIAGKDWTRIPWFDIVNHNKFSLHGVGYSGRYEAGRGRLLHGIESDDYISCEILTGHPFMTDQPSRIRGTVRKFWLSHPFIDSIKEAEIASVEFVEGNLHHLKIVWKQKTPTSRSFCVYTNRDTGDWSLTLGEEPQTVVLPPFGFYVTEVNESGSESNTGKTEKSSFCCGIIRDAETGQIIDFSEQRDESGLILYKGPRQLEMVQNNIFPIIPSVSTFREVGDEAFELEVNWNVLGKIPADYCMFVHLAERKLWWGHKILDYPIGGEFPVVPTSQWTGQVKHSFGPLAIPATFPNGTYDLYVGLYDSKGDGRRASLFGPSDGTGRYRIGQLKVERANGHSDRPVLELKPEPIDPDLPLYERLVAPEPLLQKPEIPNTPFSEYAFKSKAASRVIWNRQNPEQLILTPLPQEPQSEIVLCGPGFANVQVVAKKLDGSSSPIIPLQRDEQGCPHFWTDPEVLEYVLDCSTPK
ncbi:MAG: hypothetical protein ACRC10_08490 [Thermoguttaceae bacterium]